MIYSVFLLNCSRIQVEKKVPNLKDLENIHANGDDKGGQGSLTSLYYCFWLLNLLMVQLVLFIKACTHTRQLAEPWCDPT